MPKKTVRCRRKSAGRCRTAKKSCQYISTKKSRYCRKVKK